MRAALNRWLVIDAWPSASVFFILGLCSLAVAIALTLYMVSKRGRTRAMTRGEVTDMLMRRTLEDRGSYAISTGRGIRGDVSMGIDDLRVVARRGEWAVFWLWTALGPCYGLGLVFILTAAAVWFHEAMFALVACLAASPFLLIWPFMSWAALYTTIDAGTADPEP